MVYRPWSMVYHPASMDYQQEYKSFINSYHVSEGIRISFGLILPAVVASYFHYLPAGITMSLGASCVTMVDNAGPIHHRRNAMIICDLVIFFVALVIGLINHFPLLSALVLVLFCFSFSMIGVYGSRASSIGLAALFAMVLNIDRTVSGGNALNNACFVLCGGVWYTILSLLSYGFRPYKLTQQALGDCIEATADFLQAKAAFYEKNADYDKNFRLLMEQQVSVHEKQDLVRELLFKSRDVVKESIPAGRILVMIFLDTVDLFERVMAIQQDYRHLHELFDNSDILGRFQQLIMEMVDDLHTIGIAVKSGNMPGENSPLDEHILQLKSYFNAFRDEKRNASNVDGFISLRHILDGIEDIGDRLHTLHQYSTYGQILAKQPAAQIEYDQFVTSQRISFKLLRDNLSLQSGIFRHALRVAAATLAGYIASQFFPVGHGYWILLTIIVILKPAYGLTKKRNYARLLGTIAGAGIGLLILYFTKDRNVILGFMILFMIGAYSFMRTRYLVFVLLMTPYILLLFYLLYPHDYRTIISDRVIDTAIGSGIALLANIFVAPSREHNQFTDYLLTMIRENLRYFTDASSFFSGKKITVSQYKLSRKQAYVALANLSDAFNRILAEPRSRQQNLGRMHQLVVLNHMLTSHIATLSLYVQKLTINDPPAGYAPVIDDITAKLNNAMAALQNLPQTAGPGAAGRQALRGINEATASLMKQRKSELEQGITESDTRKKLSGMKFIADQFNFISKIAADIGKLSGEQAGERNG